MPLTLELGNIHDPAIRRAFEQVILQIPGLVTTTGGGGGAPSGPAGGVLGGTYPNPGFAADMATQAELDAHTGLTTTAHGGIVASTDPRLTDARAPIAHHATHEPGGTDAMAVDAPTATGSLRTLGTGGLQAAAGNDSRLTNARTPTAHQSTHLSGGTDALSGNLDAIARTNVKKAGTVIGTRRGLNLIEGANVTIAVADDSANEEVDVTIAAAGGSGSPATGTFRVYRNAAQSVSNGGQVTFDTELFDSSDYYAPGTGRYTPLTAGFYRLSWAISLGATITADNYIRADLRKNGTRIARGVTVWQRGTAVGPTSVGTDVVQANGTTDFFDIVLVTNNATAVTLAVGTNDATVFAGELIG